MNFEPIPFDTKSLPEQVELYIKKSALPIQEELLKKLFNCIDLTTLNSTDTKKHVSEFTQKVNSFSSVFPDLNNVAAICIYPNMAQTVKENLVDKNVKIAAVAGGFPSSMTFTSVKAAEATMAVKNGADEIDIVIPLWAFLEKDYVFCSTEIELIKTAIGDAHLKVILESGVLNDPGLIWKASVIALEAGADFIKTSTGKMPQAATPEAAIVMCHALKWWHIKTGRKCGFKPAGGISTSEEAMLYFTIVNDILGKEWLNSQLFRIGASRLANNLLSDIMAKTISHF